MSRIIRRPVLLFALALAVALAALVAWRATTGSRAAQADGPERAAGGPKVLCIGFDGMDPQLLDGYLAEGVMPNFAKLIAKGDYRRFGTAIPPQSPVAWANFITGQNPGGHGIFDFIHRDPQTLIPYLSTSEATPPEKFFRLGKWKFPRDDAHVELLRHGKAFWEILADAGVDATIFKVPSNFPPVECEARSLSDMGTPDIIGTYGIFTYLTDRPPADTDLAGGRVVAVQPRDGRFTAQIPGPNDIYREGDPESLAPVSCVIDPQNPAASFDVQGQRFVLQEGEWSDWVTLRFPLVPWLRHVPFLTGMSEVSGICRFLLMEAHPAVRIYVTPIQMDPRAPAMPISTPSDFSRRLAGAIGLYYTQGLPEDTKALEDSVLSDADYIGMADYIHDERMRMLHHELARFRGLKSGLLFFYFNSPDQSCHMFWRAMDPTSPLHAQAAAYAQRMRTIYTSLDAALGEALAAVDDRTLVMVISDHGFAPYNRSFHVNTWLLENGYLVLRPGVKQADVSYLQGVDWAKTRAYALGINGLYLNLAGREARGIVLPGADRDSLLAELVRKLEAVVDPAGGQRAIKHAYRTDQVYSGPYTKDAPDIIVGYYRGYRGSNESALGKIPATTFEDNHLKWSGDHCMAADEVPGIIVSNRKIVKKDPALVDMAPTFLELFGLTPTPEMVGSSIFAPSPKGAL